MAGNLGSVPREYLLDAHEKGENIGCCTTCELRTKFRSLPSMVCKTVGPLNDFSRTEHQLSASYTSQTRLELVWQSSISLRRLYRLRADIDSDLGPFIPLSTAHVCARPWVV